MDPSRLNILLLDDQPENLLALEAVLGDLGHRLVLANSGREALWRLLEEDFALILLDIQMPEMDGFETAQLIRGRERSHGIPIVFLTATMQTREMVFKGYAAGAVDYMFKPVVPEILRAKVEVFADLAAARKKLEIEIAERERAQSERERFFSLSHDLLCIAGFDGYFKRLNPAWEKALGYAEEELLEKPFLEFVHPEDRPATRSATETLATGKHIIAFENRYRCKDGSYTWLLWSATTVIEEQLIYAGARDYTEQKNAAEQILELNSKLQRHAAEIEAANKELEAFSYSISHDLRAPLRHIDGFARLLEKSSTAALDEKSRGYLSAIGDAAGRMGQLIDDLLAFSRTSRAPLSVARVSLDDLIQGIIRDSRLEIGDREIVWNIGPLPQVQADGSLLRQVLVNILSNALKYTRTRSPVRIEIGCLSQDEEQHVFFIRDNGVGFDMRYADKLFGVFQRLHRAEDFEGTGIGLANVQRIVARHGGRTWAEGKVGEGATFYFSLPRGPRGGHEAS